MFEKIVVVDSTGLNTWGVERLKELGKEVGSTLTLRTGTGEKTLTVCGIYSDRGRRLRTRLL